MRRRPPTEPPRSVPVGQLRRNLESVQRFRLNVVFGALLILFAGLLGRLGKLQLVEASAYSVASSERHDREHTFRGLRGRILDRHGRTLVTSRRVLQVSVDPKEVSNPRLFARRVAALLDDEALAALIYERITKAKPGCRHRSIARTVEDARVVAQLSPFVGDYIATVHAGLKGLKVEAREVRTYPNGSYAAHVLGHAPHYKEGEVQGGDGIESTFHDALKPSELTVPIQRDCRRRTCRTALAVDPTRTAGRDLVLTLDLVIQHHLETALDELWSIWDPIFATGVVLDPRTGDVLALANRPGFDPRVAAAGFNAAVQGSCPPGSLFKPFTVAHALGHGVVTSQERLPLPPRTVFEWHGHPRRVKDSHPTCEDDGCGTVTRVLSHSSNTGCALLLLRVMGRGLADGEYDIRRVRSFIDRLGFNDPTGIELVGEGQVRFGADCPWNPLFPGVGVAFGQGFGISPLRLAACWCAFARDDARIVRPSLLPGRGGPRGDLPPVCASPEDLAVIREGLAACADVGTSSRALAGVRYPVSGKTGTAEQPGTDFNFAGFCGFAPRERPRLLVLVVAKVDENHVHQVGEVRLRPYGGNVAAPAVRQVVERSLDYLLQKRVDAGSGEEEAR